MSDPLGELGGGGLDDPFAGTQIPDQFAGIMLPGWTQIPNFIAPKDLTTDSNNESSMNRKKYNKTLITTNTNIEQLTFKKYYGNSNNKDSSNVLENRKLRAYGKVLSDPIVSINTKVTPETNRFYARKVRRSGYVVPNRTGPF